MAKKKIKTVAQQVNAAAVLIQKLVRMKAADDNGYASCVTCKKVDHYTCMDGGHFIPRTRRYLVLFEENIHVQCKGCNRFGMKDTLIVLKYHTHMVDMYGEKRVRAMERLAWRSRKWTREEVAEVVAYAKEQIKYHEGRIA